MNTDSHTGFILSDLYFTILYNLNPHLFYPQFAYVLLLLSKMRKLLKNLIIKSTKIVLTLYKEMGNTPSIDMILSINYLFYFHFVAYFFVSCGAKMSQKCGFGGVFHDKS